ncbi:hypothetical protein, partial [Rhizobium ruizarguesonis]|uniref:hypothetical protein n=1 Tax=Rhizobium ruizarguesonis TaxID=2081791 RepID=UPI001AEE7788
CPNESQTPGRCQGFVSSLKAGSRRPFLYPPSQLNNQSMMSSENRTHVSASSFKARRDLSDSLLAL